jgi:glycosyltransferase involved in cell wall biosynthesis
VRHVNVPEDLSFNIFDNKFESILNTIITKENFNLVHVVHPMRLGYATKVAHSAGLPTILTLTDFWVICPGVQLLTPSGKLCYGSSDPQKCVKNCYGELWADKLTRRFKEIEELVRMVDCIVAPTQFLASLVKNVLDLHISVIPYGIDYRYIKERPEKSREQLTLGFIGTLMPHKGVHTLIDAIKLLEDNALRVKIYGDPSHHPNYYSQLTNIADNDKRIEFTGEYDYSEISRILRELDVVVVPSIWWENAPFTIQTSFAYKTPVIASNLGGMSEVVKDGVNGFLFEAGNAENLAEVIRKITTNLEVLNSIRANIISPPRIEEVAFEYEQLYRSLLSGGALDVPHPSKEMISVGEGDFKAIGEEFVQYFIELCGLKPNERILDVGSGIGRMAIPLTNYLDKNGSYEGLDIVKTEIDWCRKNISSIYPNFQFLLTDIYNKRYNIRGKYIAAEYK